MNKIPKLENEHGVKRVIVCAACKFGNTIIAGPRHFDSVMRSQMLACHENSEVKTLPKSKVEQGFVDQFGEFWTRREAFYIATLNEQPINMERNGNNEILYSEGLY